MIDQNNFINTNIDYVIVHQNDDSLIIENNLLNNFSDDKLNKFEIKNSITFDENVNIKYLEKIVKHFDNLYPFIGKVKDHKKGYKGITDKKTVFTMLEKRLKNMEIIKLILISINPVQNIKDCYREMKMSKTILIYKKFLRFKEDKSFA
jgi:hypothetical protein